MAVASRLLPVPATPSPPLIINRQKATWGRTHGDTGFDT
jgi:hypothetical protein